MKLSEVLNWCMLNPGRFDNNKFTVMVWYVGDQLSAY